MVEKVQKIVLSDKVKLQLMQRIDELAAISEAPDNLTRRFATAEHRKANDLATQWMLELGMSVHEDAIGNVRGRYEGQVPGGKAILVGSHLDTVIDAGRFDGMLGVLSAIACVQTLYEQDIRLPYAIEVVCFADEEGVRYQSTFLGSRAMAGTFDPALLDKVDKDGISMASAIEQFGHSTSQLQLAACSAEEFVGYLELHIEQGPVLEQKNIPVGVVKAISGATRLMIKLRGVAGHAGTVPMSSRQDALVAASQCVLAVRETCSGKEDLVGTVGAMDVSPGAGNVIPGSVNFSVDIRAADDPVRIEAVDSVLEQIQQIASAQKVEIEILRTHDAESVHCDAHLIAQVSAAIEGQGHPLVVLSSGAGHDAAAMAHITPVCMIFVRCKGGVSHNPAESVTTEDAGCGAQLMLDSLVRIASEHNALPA
ncbi:MAG: allantoate amidohydrolase [Granulosicoccus sp.]